MKIETQSIGFIPDEERYGREERLFTIWFSMSLTTVCLTVGTLGILAGLSLPATLAALLIGNTIGTIFMAAHSAQGPHLGIPQMIQSRAQFGVFGAALPLLAVILTYLLYAAADAVIIAPTIVRAFGCGPQVAMAGFGLATLVVAFVGYELIHKFGIVMAVVSSSLIILTILLLLFWSHPAIAHAAPAGAFTFGAFMATVTQAISWSLTFGPYVADYSRYLPRHVSTPKTFWFTSLGNFLSTSLAMGLGALMAARYAGLVGDPGSGIALLFGPAESVVRVLIILGILLGNVMTLYSAYMASATVFAGFSRSASVSLATKFLVLLAIIALATWIAIVTMDGFDKTFGAMLALMSYLLVPWSAINLADFYLVRFGRYDVEAMFVPEGEYGRWNVSTLVIFAVSVVVQVPFMILGPFTGPVAARIGADLSWIPGLVVPAVLFVIFERRKLRQYGARIAA